MYTECFLCHQYCDTEKHHIFGGVYGLAQQVGATVRRRGEELFFQLCPYCHRDNKEGVHNNREKMQALHEYGQRKAMEEHGWTIEDFIANFYKNYI